MQFPDEKIPIRTRETYLALIRNSAGTTLFRNAYATRNGKRFDIFENGNLSCAFFVTTILTIVELIPRPYTHVWKTEEEMKRAGWKKISKPKVGAVLVWASKANDSGETHRHIGFFLGKDKAMSNIDTRGCPAVHHWTFGTKNNQPVRRIEAIYWHKNLQE